MNAATERAVAWARANPERAAENKRRWAKKNPERRREARRAWEDRNRELINERRRQRAKEARQKTAAKTRRERKLYPEKYQARTAVSNALQEGRLTKPDTCEDCGEPTKSRDLHGHHEDYSKPLDVEWLCATCHGKRHRTR